MVAKPMVIKASAPAMDMGTDTRMISGSRQLSNWAASTRYITRMDRKKVIISALPCWAY